MIELDVLNVGVNYLDEMTDTFKMKQKVNDWKYAEERKALIKFAESLLDKKFNKFLATDLVDACIVSAWEYREHGTLLVTGKK